MKKVAIVNRTNLKNYGSILQVYALCEAVSALGYDAEIVWEAGNLAKNYDLRLNKIISIVQKLMLNPGLIKGAYSTVQYVQQKVISDMTVRLFDAFVRESVRRAFYPRRKMNKRQVGSMYDKFICGSDQIWCTTALYVDPLMYLRFAPEEKRIAYAPSLGRDYIPDYNRRRMRRFIGGIPDVSVREYTGQRLIKELTDRDVPVVLDPTLLLLKKHWDTVKKAPSITGGYIVCYFLSTPTEDTQKKIVQFLKKRKNKVVALNSRLEYVEIELCVEYPDCGPREFLGFVSGAEYVLTDSYHGMLFSIIYQRQFVSIEREYGEYDQSSRQLSVLGMLGLEDRHCKLMDQISESAIDYSVILQKIESERKRSLNYLKRALEK